MAENDDEMNQDPNQEEDSDDNNDNQILSPMQNNNMNMPANEDNKNQDEVIFREKEGATDKGNANSPPEKYNDDITPNPDISNPPGDKKKPGKPGENKPPGKSDPNKENDPKEVVKNNIFDEAVDVSNASQSVESGKEEEEPRQPIQNPPAKTNIHFDKPVEFNKNQAPSQAINYYNPADYANLKVSDEISELFQYISRFKPQEIPLETKLKPFIPDYIPAVGEVDAFLKIPKPDGDEESLGLLVLDEPTINPIDPSVLEMHYLQTQKKKQDQKMTVRSIEDAEKNPKQIQQWISSVNELHKSRPPPTIQYSKKMPDIEKLMQEWSPDMEDAFEKISFPTPDIDMSVADYAKIICLMLDIPVNKLSNKKGLVEALHLIFSLYNEFKQNPHFQHNSKNVNESKGEDRGDVNILKIV